MPDNPYKCMNCNADLPPEANYCHDCGARNITTRLNATHLFENITHDIFEWDSGFIKTVKDLTISPGKVNDYFIKGGRKRYLNPIKYLIICLIILQLITLLFGSTFFLVSGMKGFIRGWYEVEDSIPTDDELNHLDKMVDFAAFILLFGIPALALITDLSYQKCRLIFMEHLAINIYLFAHMLLLTIIITLPFEQWESHSYIYIISFAYTYFFHLKTFKDSYLMTLVKSTIYFFVGYSICIMIWGFIALAWLNLN